MDVEKLKNTLIKEVLNGIKQMEIEPKSSGFLGVSDPFELTNGRKVQIKIELTTLP